MSEAVLSSSGTSLVRSMSVIGISDHADLTFDFLTPSAYFSKQKSRSETCYRYDALARRHYLRMTAGFHGLGQYLRHHFAHHPEMWPPIELRYP